MDYIEWNAKKKNLLENFPLKRPKDETPKNFTFHIGLDTGVTLVVHILALPLNHSLFSNFVEKTTLNKGKGIKITSIDVFPVTMSSVQFQFSTL